MTTIQQLVLKFIEGLDPKISLKDALTVVHSQIDTAMKITNTIEENFKAWGKGQSIACPHCGSPTLFEFVECHWCGHQVLETVNGAESVVETIEAPKTVTDTPKNREAKMGDEPAATLNFEGKSQKELKEEKEKKPRGSKKDKEQKEVKEDKKETPAKEEVKDTSIEVKSAIKLLRDAAAEASKKETDGNALKEINKTSGLNIDAKKDCDGKLSLFRAEIVKRLNQKADDLEKALADAEKKKAADAKTSKKTEKATKPKKETKSSKKKEELADADFPEEEEMEEVPSKFKDDKKEIDITDEDLSEEDDLFGEDATDAEMDAAIADDDLEGGEAIDLDSIDVDDLSEDDFEIDD